MSTYDIVMVGHVSKDIIIYQGQEERLLGGAVVQSSAAATRSGARVLVVTKAAQEDRELLRPLEALGTEYRIIESPQTTSIENIYESEDRERRKVTLIAQAAPFSLEELDGLDTRIYHLAGLFAGELPESLIEPLSRRAPVAIDAQGLLRRSENGKLLFRDWADKARLLPFVTYLKTDAAEAEILTGSSDREAAARELASLGADEVMVTHNSEVIVFDGEAIRRAPFTPANLSGRTGRGDTCFASYLVWRLGHGVQESVDYAAALTSMKMERPGPFDGSVAKVLERVERDRGRQVD
ncbi:MAG TPA: PfkB family carbohydrate kinase [Spirochaetia bacterium]|nr:PfkB family carbohydrate kinase [Spirochaetia bacterium]